MFLYFLINTVTINIKMHKLMIRNGTPFPMQKLKTISGYVPKSILGSYFKNGPALFNIGNQLLPHWFMGNSGLLKLQLHDGNAYARYKMIETPAYKHDLSRKDFNRPNPVLMMIKQALGIKANMDQYHNSANTSVLRVPNSKNLYTLYEGGLPFKIEEKQMKEGGFQSFNFISKGYSAHPKIDPQNGDIYNLGFNSEKCEISRTSKDLKLITKNNIKLRVPQSIHDCCLAGNYFVVFECPVKVDMIKLLKGLFGVKCYSMDYDFGKTIAHIYKKQSLEFVKKIQLKSPEPFYFFHFTNGYQQNNKLYIQYCKYPGANAQKILDLVDYMPNYALNDNKPRKKINLFSELEAVQIDLSSNEHKFSQKDYDCEFPLCQDHEVGKKWQYSYFLAKNKNSQLFDYNKLVRFDRINNKQLVKQFSNCCIVEPILVRTTQGFFIMIIKSSSQRCSLQILNGDTFETIGQLQLPQYIPFGFHGRWLEIKDKSSLESQFL